MQRSSLRAAAAATVLLLTGVAVEATDTRFWQQYDPSDYDKATLSNVALRSDGRLSLAPVFKELYDTSTPYLWAVAEDSKGNVYAGGGAPGATSAKLFLVDAAGKTRVVTEVPGVEIHSIAIDRQDRVYVATSPDGKVYRVGADGKAQEFYDPKAKYIWAMVFGPNGDLFVATGDQGEIHKVTPAGQGSVFFETEETHARSLAVDAKGNLIVGTDPGGLIIRVAPDRNGFVLHQSSKREVTAVAVAKDGSVYAAAVGSKAPAPVVPPVTAQPAPTSARPPSAAAPAAAAQRPQQGPVLPPTLTITPTVAGGAEVYRIDPDGAPLRVWNHATDIVYALAFDAQGRPLLGTGNRGRIYRIDSPHLNTLLVSSTSTQVTAFASSPKGPVYAVTANIGKVFQLGPALEKQGTLESEVLDAGSFSYWGRARWEGVANGGKVTVETRSGNLDRPQKNWSAWSAVPLTDTAGRMAAPAARFLQYKLKIDAAANGRSPEVTMVELAYLGKNVAPVVDAVESTPANYKYPAPSSTTAAAQTLSLPPIGQRGRSSSGLTLDSGSASLTYAKGHIGARWRAGDANDDTLLFKVEIRGEGESAWRLLKDRIREKQYSWDSTAFADGRYQIRVTATDAPSNAEGEALTTSLESEPFLIDNTPPQIVNLRGAMENGKLVVRWQARDKASVIETAEYSLNGGDWLPVIPVSRLSDSLTLDYVLTLDRPAGGGDAIVAVRVADEFENQTVDKVTVK